VSSFELERERERELVTQLGERELELVLKRR
jgi:hypothetical protein